ncbi:MAG: TIGR03960 family B12-binding radical SAM protein [Lachnospiraceae bacterium]|jgi:radical SAM family uncharacterized protein|nr:TIGR03960 family B12-binding radical SAM protein [Lachnospiraceae bacterium]
MNLALSEKTLMQVDKPARYIGNEVGSIIKEKSKVAIRFALCFPDLYEIGMSNLGIQILYGLLNSYDDVWCERVFSPQHDLEQIMREQKIPLFSLESQESISQFDFLGITIQYEMCYSNILQILDLAGITLLAKDRREDEPLIIGGGPCCYNPEPLVDFFDLIYIGEGEVMLRELMDKYQANRENGGSREDFLYEAAMLAGVYVPRFYEVEYHEDHTIAARRLLRAGVPMQVKKVACPDLTDTFYPTKPIVPFIQTTHDRGVLEIMRGCPRKCRFCQAGHVYGKKRERKAEDLVVIAEEILKNTGYDEIGLSSLSSSDYSQLKELTDALMDRLGQTRTNISLPSLRIDSISLDIMKKVQDVRKSSLTFAPEAGSQRLREVIGKGLTEETILTGARAAFSSGWRRVKLYFMLGLPTEQEEDILAIGDLANKITAEYYDTVPKSERLGKVEIGVSTSFFVPKPFTPLQWAGQATVEEFREKANLTRQGIASQLNQKSIKYSWHETNESILEAAMARGDRRLGAVILWAYQNGARFDAWGEHQNPAIWEAAFKAIFAENRLDIAFFATRERSPDEILPWDFIDCGVSKDYLLAQRPNR